MFFAGQPDTVRLPPTSAAASDRPVGGVLKRGVDIIAAFTALILLAPLLVIVSLLVLTTLGRPILCRPTYVGFGGRVIACYRFRTQQATGAHGQSTSLGNLLTLSGIDKLPQLFNVLMGELSCVGPPPLVMDQKRFSSGETNPKLRARPGIAGAWPQGFAVTGSDEAAALDNAYVRSWSMRGDIRILCRMIPELAHTGNAKQEKSMA